MDRQDLLQELSDLAGPDKKEPVQKSIEEVLLTEHSNWDEQEANLSPTGSKRFNKDKLPMHLIPPSAINGIAEVLKYGATKYSERNWERGNNYSVPYASLMRHLLAFWSGETHDPESKLPHTYHILMNAAMLVEYEQMEGDFDDRPNNPRNP